MRYRELRALYERPLIDLILHAAEVHRNHWPGRKVQLCTLLSIKTGGCPEDCGYCSQSVRYRTPSPEEPLLDPEEVLRNARKAKAAGATRFCMGAAWRSPRNEEEFSQVLEMVRRVRSLGIEACVTLGMLNRDQALRLKEAGLTSYNHNLDTSPEFYEKVVRTHRFEDRIATLEILGDLGIRICSGGIFGLGETPEDRLRLIEVLSELEHPPESVPLNKLVPIPGTPMEGRPGVDVFELVRMVAVTRCALPEARVRLSAGREGLSEEAQALCFLAGANSIFYGEKLLTTGGRSPEEDRALLERLGLECEEGSWKR